MENILNPTLRLLGRLDEAYTAPVMHPVEVSSAEEYAQVYSRLSETQRNSMQQQIEELMDYRIENKLPTTLSIADYNTLLAQYVDTEEDGGLNWEVIEGALSPWISRFKLTLRDLCNNPDMQRLDIKSGTWRSVKPSELQLESLKSAFMELHSKNSEMLEYWSFYDWKNFELKRFYSDLISLMNIELIGDPRLWINYCDVFIECVILGCSYENY
jgi:hypothetical protein